MSPSDPLPATVSGTADPRTVSAPPSTRSPLFSNLTPTNHPAAESGSLSDYEIVRELGRGGMGVVYEARDLKENRTVALKMVLSEGALPMADVIRFLAEADAQSHIDHPNVVRVLKLGESAGQPYMVLEYLSGGSLADRFRKERRLAPRAAAALLEKLARGVHAAHAKGIFHRDLKPGNVLFDAAGEPKIADFGLAKRDLSNLTRTGFLLGTPAYMAPEQASGRRELVAAPTDVWALGVILYEAVTGTRPFDAPRTLPSEQQIMALLNMVINETPPAPRAVVPEIPLDLEKVCLKCLEKEPADRYPTAEALADDLAAFAAGKPVGVRSLNWIERGAKWAKKRPTAAAAWALATVALVLGAFAGMAVLLWQRAVGERGHAVVARVDAESERYKAEEARDALTAANHGLVEARQAAEDERGKVVLARDQLAQQHFETAKARDALLLAQDRLVYARTLEVAFQEFRDGGNLPRVRAMLAGTNPALRGWEYEYVSRAIDRQQLALAGHAETIEAVAVSPDGSLVASASNIMKDVDDIEGAGGFKGPGRRAVGFEIRLWDAATGKLRKTLRVAGKGWINSLDFSPDGERLASAGDAVRLWNVESGEVERTFAEAGSPACFTNQGRRIAAPKLKTLGEVGFWNTATGKEVAAVGTHAGRIYGIAVSPDGTLLATTADVPFRQNGADERGEMKVWNVALNQEVFTAKLRTFPSTNVAFSPDGKTVATARSPAAGTAATHIQIWDAASGFEGVKVPVPNMPWSIAYNRDGSQLAVACGILIVADPKTGKPIHQLRQQYAFCAAYSASDDRLVSGGTDKIVKVWRLGDGDGRVMNPRGANENANPYEYTRLAFSPDGSRLAAAGSRGRIWDTVSGDTVAEFKPMGAMTMAFHPRGDAVATSAGDNTVTIWNAKTGAAQVVPPNQKPGDSSILVKRIAFSPDGKTLAAPTYFEGLRVWDAATGQPRGPERWYSSQSCAAFHPSGAPLAVTDWHRIHLFDPNTGKSLGAIEAPDKDTVFTDLAFSPDGKRLAAGTMVGDILLWTLDGKNAPPELIRAHTGNVAAISFSPDSARLASCGDTDGRVVVWDPESRESVLTIYRDPVAVRDVAFGKGGRLAATCGNGTVRLWSLDR